MRDGMNDFLRSAHAANSDMPTDVRALEDAVGVRLVSGSESCILIILAAKGIGSTGLKFTIANRRPCGQLTFLEGKSKVNRRSM